MVECIHCEEELSVPDDLVLGLDPNQLACPNCENPVNFDYLVKNADVSKNDLRDYREGLKDEKKGDWW